MEITENFTIVGIPSGENGKNMGANLLEGTNLIRSNSAWNQFNGDVILNGGVFGTNSIRQIYNGPDEFVNVLQQKISDRDQSRSKLQRGKWYTLSFWARGSIMTTYLYGEKEIVDMSSGCIVDGVEKPALDGGRNTWQLNERWEVHTFAFKVSDSAASGNCLFRVFKGDNAEISAIKLEEGERATDWCLNEKDKVGAKLRMTEWTQGRRYLSGQAGESFYDVVIYKADPDDKGTLYLCIKTVDEESKLGQNDPRTSAQTGLGIWEVAQNWKFVATDLLLTKRIEAKDIVTEDITVQKLETASEDNSATIKIENGTIKIYGKNKDQANIEFGVNENGEAVLRYFDSNGRYLYDLGPKHITDIDSVRFVPKSLCYITDVVEAGKDDVYPQVVDTRPTTYYQFKVGSLPSQTQDGIVYENNRLSGQNPAPTNKIIPNGWYTDSFGAAKTRMLTDMPIGSSIFIGLFMANKRYNYREIFYVSGGKIDGFVLRKTVYWSDETIQ